MVAAAARTPAAAAVIPRAVLGADGVLRWQPGGEEVNLFGVNYGLASASAYRFLKQSGASTLETIRRDLAHLRRMGANALRLPFWGDWENSDPQGNLLENEHLLLLDAILVAAGLHGMRVLLSPIVTYDASWPDVMAAARSGFSSVYSKDELGLNAAACAAQTNYLRRLLERRNSYSGIAYKDEPAIFAIEPINEPAQHPERPEITLGYINALARAIRDTGWLKPVVYNVSQDMKMATLLAAAQIDGATFAWYPTGLENGRPVGGNCLLLVDDYAQMREPLLRHKAKLVYEFDAADSMASYLYPAMARAFRGGGAQFAAMFSYDAVPIAANNLEFNDHFLSLIYTPAKALSFLIAGRVFAQVPRGADFGLYPHNMHFGTFSVDDRADRSECVTDAEFLYSNHTPTVPPKPAALVRIAGVGSSPIVAYDGTGAYFLDRLAPGVWRLEVYPDSIIVRNPFDHEQSVGAVAQLVWRERSVRVELADLGSSFVVEALVVNRSVQAVEGRFSVTPGVYVLRRSGIPAPHDVDRSFYAPQMQPFEPVLLHEPPRFLQAGATWSCRVEYVAAQAPERITLHYRNGTRAFKSVLLQSGPGFEYAGDVPAAGLEAGMFDYFISVRTTEALRTYPVDAHVEPGEWDFPNTHGWRAPVLGDGQAVALFDASVDFERLIVPYGGYQPYPAVSLSPGPDLQLSALRLDGRDLEKTPHGEVVCQLGLLECPGLRAALARPHHALRVLGHATGSAAARLGLILIERDGSAWGATAVLGVQPEVEVPLGDFKPVQAAMLPRDFPVGINPYWLRSPNRGALRLENVEALQLCLATRFLTTNDVGNPLVEVRQVLLE
jgi:hypothetical protein